MSNSPILLARFNKTEISKLYPIDFARWYEVEQSCEVMIDLKPTRFYFVRIQGILVAFGKRHFAESKWIMPFDKSKNQ
jgi:hypothetical protein